jgi:hypothetical protein
LSADRCRKRRRQLDATNHSSIRPVGSAVVIDARVSDDVMPGDDDAVAGQNAIIAGA